MRNIFLIRVDATNGDMLYLSTGGGDTLQNNITITQNNGIIFNGPVNLNNVSSITLKKQQIEKDWTLDPYASQYMVPADGQASTDMYFDAVPLGIIYYKNVGPGGAVQGLPSYAQWHGGKNFQNVWVHNALVKSDSVIIAYKIGVGLISVTNIQNGAFLL